MSRIFLLALLLGWAAPCLANSRPPIYVLGFDGLSWKILTPLMDRLPNLSRCASVGVSGKLKSLSGYDSAALWTTVATGVPPRTHGILDFVDSKNRAYTSRDRKAPALWNMLTQGGRSSLVVNYFMTSPAESIDGVIVSKEYRYRQPSAGLIYPSSATARISSVAEPDLSTASLTCFLGPEPSPGPETQDLLKKKETLQGFYYGDEFSTRIAEELLSERPYDLFLFHFWGTDTVAHMFGLYSSFDDRPVPPLLKNYFGDVVEHYYAYADEVVGRLQARLPPDGVLLIVSDHGLKASHRALSPTPSGVSTSAPNSIFWEHDYDDAVIIACGKAVAHARLDGATLLDVAPTILYLQNLPIPRSMSGQVLKELVDPAIFATRRPASVDSYQVIRDTSPVDTEGISRSLREKLRAAGYIQ
jgi:predicted AlkP superfamily phosphohydrolase/phosphomutase